MRIQTLVRPGGLGKVHPLLNGTQKRSQRLRTAALGYGKREHPHTSLGVAVICWGASTAHGERKAFLSEKLARCLCSTWLALITVKHGRRHVKGQGLQRCGDRRGTHVGRKRQSQEVPGALPEREAASHLGPIRPCDLKPVGEHDFGQALRVQLTDLIGRHLARFAWRETSSA